MSLKTPHRSLIWYNYFVIFVWSDFICWFFTLQKELNLKTKFISAESLATNFAKKIFCRQLATKNYCPYICRKTISNFIKLNFREKWVGKSEIEIKKIFSDKVLFSNFNIQNRQILATNLAIKLLTLIFLFSDFKFELQSISHFILHTYSPSSSTSLYLLNFLLLFSSS